MTGPEAAPERRGRPDETKLAHAARLAAELLRTAQDAGDPELVAAARMAAFAAGVALARSLAPDLDMP